MIAKPSDKPTIYEAAPPSWLPKTSRNLDLGYQAFFPPQPSQNEDLLTDAYVKQGFTLKHAVPAETFTNKVNLIKLLKDDYSPELEDFMNQIFKRRQDDLPQIPTSSYRVPSRVTLNEARRQAYFTDLANPNVPLYKLGKNIPHGVRGHDLLDLLRNNNVSIPRAVWFVRVLGNNEIAGIRNKPNYNHLQYSVDWAIVMTSYIKKQLSDIALPSAPRPGLNIKQTFKGVLSDPETRDKWVGKFVYTLELLRVFYPEFMVDHTTFLSWLVQLICSCNLAQAGFVARLADDFLDDLAPCRALAKTFADGCLSKLTEIAASASKDCLTQLQERLEDLLSRLFSLSPLTFISPGSWKVHSETMRGILLGFDLNSHSDMPPHVRQNLEAYKAELEEMYENVGMRNEALLFRTSNAQPSKGCLRSTVADVQLLNSITTSTDLGSIRFFDSRIDPSSHDFSHKLGLLLSWSVCCMQFGDHRPYAAVSLMRAWRDQAGERACRRDADSPNDIIQDEIFSWLDTSDLAGDERNLRALSLLFGELVDKQLFSYDRYIQRVIARGEIGLSFNDEVGSRHRMFLRVIPLHNFDPALTNQRRYALYGARARQIPEDEVEKSLRQELSNLLPEAFGLPEPTPTHLTSLSPHLVLRNSSRYEQVRVLRPWFIPALRKFISRCTIGSSADRCLRVYCTAVEILETMKFFRALFDVNLDVLKVVSDHDLLTAVIATLRRHTDIWACMDRQLTMLQALCETYRVWKARGVHMRPLVSFILEIDDGRLLDADVRQNLIDSAAHYAQALCPADNSLNSIPQVLPEILLLAQDPIPEAPSVLANTLWYKYRTSSQWTWIVWDNVIASLRQIPAMIPIPAQRTELALRYAKFLLCVDKHSPHGIDSQALKWFRGSGFKEMTALCAGAWNVAGVVFLQLAIHGALKITTLLQGVVYPVWRLCSSSSASQDISTVNVLLEAANALCDLLMVRHQWEGGDGIHPTPANLFEMQQLRTRRKEVFQEHHYRLLLGSVPDLVFLEHKDVIDASIRETANQLRLALCSSADFRLGALRYLDAVLETFETSLDPERIQDNMHEPLVSALRFIFDDVDDDHPPETGTFLSPWKLSASAAVTSFVLRHIGRRMTSQTTKSQAEAELAGLVENLLHENITGEEADYISEMAKGVNIDVAGKFVNEGLKRITEILAESNASETGRFLTMTEKAGDILKLLITIISPFRSSTSSPPVCLPPIEERVQNSFIPQVIGQFEACLSFLSDEDDNGKQSMTAIEDMEMTEPIMFLARLLQFNLGFPGFCTQTTREDGKRLLHVIFRLALVFCAQNIVNTVAFTVLLDTAFYVFDELPRDTKQASMDLFQYCPMLERSSFPFNMPEPLRESAQTLLRFQSNSNVMDGLVYAHRDSDGNLIRGAPVEMRPWDWIEYVGDAPLESNGNGSLAQLSNNTSIPLECFDVKLTGERIRHWAGGRREEAFKNIFEDDLVSESMYERDWRESRVGLFGNGGITAGPSKDTTVGRPSRTSSSKGKGNGGATSNRGSSGSRGGSPALSVRTSVASQSSMNPPSATSSVRRTQSPAIEKSATTNEVIDVDALDIGKGGGKRKAPETFLDEDDDVVIVYDSAVERSDTKRTKGKAPVGKTVAGKTKRK